MSYDDAFADRLRELLASRADVTEKAMFGGLAFLLAGNMAVGIASTGELIVRVAPEETDDALAEPDTRQFDMSGRPMKGWILVRAESAGDEDRVAAWVEREIRFAQTLPPKK
jgi:TfoX/Sxy family transcriptional regulator of competence genes